MLSQDYRNLIKDVCKVYPGADEQVRLEEAGSFIPEGLWKLAVNYSCHTLRELGEIYGVSHETIRARILEFESRYNAWGFIRLHTNLLKLKFVNCKDGAQIIYSIGALILEAVKEFSSEKNKRFEEKDFGEFLEFCKIHHPLLYIAFHSENAGLNVLYLYGYGKTSPVFRKLVRAFIRNPENTLHPVLSAHLLFGDYLKYFSFDENVKDLKYFLTVSAIKWKYQIRYQIPYIAEQMGVGKENLMKIFEHFEPSIVKLIGAHKNKTKFRISELPVETKKQLVESFYYLPPPKIEELFGVEYKEASFYVEKVRKSWEKKLEGDRKLPLTEIEMVSFYHSLEGENKQKLWTN